MRGGDWVRVPRGTRVRSEATRVVTERRTSYPLQLLRVEGGRAYWLGDRDQLFSTPLAGLEPLPGYQRGSVSRRSVVVKRGDYGPRVIRCPHGFLPPLCSECHP